MDRDDVALIEEEPATQSTAYIHARWIVFGEGIFMRVIASLLFRSEQRIKVGIRASIHDEAKSSS